MARLAQTADLSDIQQEILSTVRSFDRIVVLQEGRIIEDGSPDHLLRREGSYRQLIRREMNRLSKNAA